MCTTYLYDFDASLIIVTFYNKIIIKSTIYSLLAPYKQLQAAPLLPEDLIKIMHPSIVRRILIIIWGE